MPRQKDGHPKPLAGMTKVTTIRMRPEEGEKLARLGKRKNISGSNWIRGAINRAYDRTQWPEDET